MSENQRRRSIFDVMGEYMDEFEAWADEVMESAFPEGPSWNNDACCLYALCNVFVTPHEFIVTADLPNIEPETVKFELNENLFEIKAEMKKKFRFVDLGIYYRQGESSSLRCQIHVPVVVDASKMTISNRGRLWEIRFPRKRDSNNT
jgi:HSP20 family molecular chaperone IbpA